MNKHPLYDIAVSEVRGEATYDERARLAANVFEWRDALHSVIDEVETQLVLKSEEFEDQIELAEESGDESLIRDARNSYDVWRSRARTFKKHVSARLMAVKRMCNEQSREVESVVPNLQKALEVVKYAVEYVRLDRQLDQNDSTDLYADAEESFLALSDAVDDYEETLREP